jgi:hypothetical protein
LNCEKLTGWKFLSLNGLEIWVDGKPHARIEPDRQAYPNLKYPPFIVDLNVDGAGKPELRIDGYIAHTLSLSRSLSSDTSTDQLRLHTDDVEIQADGADAARVEFGVVDQFGAARPFAPEKIQFELTAAARSLATIHLFSTTAEGWARYGSKAGRTAKAKSPSSQHTRLSAQSG